jgi:hypothetical protein
MKSWRRLEWASARDQQETHRCVQLRDGTDSCFSNDVKSPSLDEEMVVWIFSNYPLEMSGESSLRVRLYMPLVVLYFLFEKESVVCHVLMSPPRPLRAHAQPHN